MIKLSITISIGDCEKVITLDEAKTLYHELGMVFSADTGSVSPSLVVSASGESVSPSELKGEAKVKEPDTGMKYFTENEKVSYHPDVVAAKERAKKASTCCGS